MPVYRETKQPLVYAEDKVLLKTLEEIVIETKWVHQKTNKKCTVIGTYKVGQRERDYTFRITGWNPLPCKEFKGAYYVLADWLYENGWVRQISDNKYEPGIVRYIHK